MKWNEMMLCFYSQSGDNGVGMIFLFLLLQCYDGTALTLTLNVCIYFINNYDYHLFMYNTLFY